MDVFISYSRRDVDAVDEFVTRLENEGYSVWIDRSKIRGGDKFKEKISQAIKDSSVVLFFSSQNSKQSEWTTREIGLAGCYKKIIIPILLDNSGYNASLELELHGVNYIDYSNPLERRDKMEELIYSIKSKLPTPDGEKGTGNDKTNNSSHKPFLLIGLIVSSITAVILFLHGGNTDSIPDSNHNSDTSIFVKDISFVMKYVEGGTFQMGATKEQEDEALDNEKPVRYVTVGPFFISETEVTQSLWKSVMESEPTANGGWSSQYGKGDDYPAYMLSWNDCQKFIEKLNNLTGKQFRLPVEAEWEFAARGGNRSKHLKYAGDSIVDRVAWYQRNSLEKSHPVKSANPNELGLYDMSGNVWEWCMDEYSDGDGKKYDCLRVLRGGSWKHKGNGCRVSARTFDEFDNPRKDFGLYYGFRIVLPK